MATKVEIKICGLKTAKDIQNINNLDIDYIGFVFAPSKRQVTPQQAKTLINELNPKIKTVGVFVNMDIKQVNDIAEFCPLDIVQLHGAETQKECSRVIKPVWMSLPVGSQSDVDRHKDYPDVDGILFDTFIPGLPGGSGVTFSWDLVKDVARDKIILAGGLSPHNVQEAIAQVGPHVVDISSGVETNGVKDIIKIKQFIRSVRANG